MFGDVLGLIVCSLFMPYSYMLGIWLQSKSWFMSKYDIAPTVQLTCSQHYFNRALLDWMYRKIQTRGTRVYSLLICNLRCTVAADIVLPMNTVTIDVTRVEVTLRFCLAKIAVHWEKSNICDQLSCFNAPHSRTGRYSDFLNRFIIRLTSWFSDKSI